MNDTMMERSPDDAVFETLLTESLGGPSPPDLTAKILHRIDTPSAPARTVRRAERASGRRRSSAKRWAAGWIAVGTAASVGLAIAWWDRPERPRGVAMTPTAQPQTEPDRRIEPPTPAAPRTLPPARTLTPPAVLNADRPSEEKTAPVGVPQNDRPVEMESLTGPVQMVRATLVAAWDRHGVTAAPEAPAEEIADRLRERLSVVVRPAALSDAEALAAELGSEENRQRIAGRLLRHWGVENTEAQTELARSLGGGADAVLAGWLRPGGRWQELTESMPPHQRIVSTAAVAMNVDLRCSRCHDDLVGLPSQSDYWSLASALQTAAGDQRSTGIFYDSADGRRQMAATTVRQDWVADGGQALGGDWVARRRLAGSLVAAGWEIMHGSPLRPSAYDLSSVPADAIGMRIETPLADDLVAGGFDVVRLMTIIARGGAVDRQTPPALLPRGLLIATDAEVRDAMHAVDAFAAAGTSRPVAVDQRLAMVRREIARRDVSFDTEVPTTLAQIRPTGEVSVMTGADGGDAAFAVVGTGGVTAPGWWTSLPANSRIDHLVYLAGLERLDRRHRATLEQLQAVSDDPSLFLQQAWWMIRR